LELVRIKIFSVGTLFSSLEKVDCNKLFPEPNISWNCFGKAALLTGQNREPTPPAIKIA
jgi:hypothetical protein